MAKQSMAPLLLIGGAAAIFLLSKKKKDEPTPEELEAIQEKMGQAVGKFATAQKTAAAAVGRMG